MGTHGLGETQCGNASKILFFLTQQTNDAGNILLLLQFYILSFVTIIVEKKSTISSKPID